MGQIMRRIKARTLKNAFALWLAYLTYLVLMHSLSPDDPWDSFFFRPAFLVLAPLVVACIPLLASSPKQSEPDDGLKGEDEGEYSAAKKNSPGTVRKVVLVWLVSLVVFASPHMRDFIWDPILHNPVFLLIAPLLLACIPLVRSWQDTSIGGATTFSQSVNNAAKRGGALLIMIVSLFLIFLDICGLVTVNSSLTPGNVRSALGANLFLGFGLIILFLGLWISWKNFRGPR